MTELLELLARADKWYLSGGDGVMFAPAFPQWLDHPGFWDEATIHQYAWAPVFTVSALDAEGHDVPMRVTSRRWTPAELTVDYRLANGMLATEVRTVTPGGIFGSEWRVQGLRDAPIHLVAWTAQRQGVVEEDHVPFSGSIIVSRTLHDRRDRPMKVAGELACIGDCTSWATSLAEQSVVHPTWSHTPFAEKWTGDGLTRELRSGSAGNNEWLFAAVHRRVAVGLDGVAAGFAMRLVADMALGDPGVTGTDIRQAEPGSMATGRTTRAPAAATLGGASRRRWQQYVERAPVFRCSDPYFEHYYWYRWYGLGLNAVGAGSSWLRHHAICEGIGARHQPTAVAAPAHVRELRWLNDPEPARGVLRTFIAAQRPDGSIPARLFATDGSGEGVAHADWGGAVLALDDVWPDESVRREAATGFARHGEWLLRTCDPGGSGMIDALDGTYPLVAAADDGGASAVMPPRKALDGTVFAYSLARMLETVALRSGHPPDARRWRIQRERIAAAAREAMWDPVQDMFFDVAGGSGERTGEKGALAFLPYMTDIAGAEHLAGLERHLLDPAEFWTTFPVPTVALDEPAFSAYGELRGVRRLAPRTGRTWPSVNSFVVEALAHTALHFAPRLRAHTARLVSRFVRMMFHDGDLARPNCYEHYNPLTGHAALNRGIDDHQRSWVVDLIISYVAGLRPHHGGITIDPFPFELDRVELRGALVRGVRVDVAIEGNRVRARVGEAEHESTIGTPIEVQVD